MGLRVCLVHFGDIISTDKIGQLWLVKVEGRQSRGFMKFVTAAEAASCQSGLDVSDAAPPVIRCVLMHPVTLAIYFFWQVYILSAETRKEKRVHKSRASTLMTSVNAQFLFLNFFISSTSLALKISRKIMTQDESFRYHPDPEPSFMPRLLTVWRLLSAAGCWIYYL